ncbi:Methanogenic corrinoid protein MtbC1 [Loktanella fryxellensis]|uniref:Methanogenic corrinoid protein MtbC1 n=1 Tax=Loktanella fryxellensis TaxID=245187 RepID=A0A1H8GIQ0_9RHOB|nr:B12-binding domain-containing protein [Loktanella fryxellensis]SEN43655.1 Methanogenic corrinoid protein MtbC1 [Loktanella fryxellensis]
MARQQRDDEHIDHAAWFQAQTQFSRLTTALPEAAVGNVAMEVVRRLAFRMPRFGEGEDGPDAAEIDRFCTALTAPDEDAADRIVRNLRRSGNSANTIYLSYISAAARVLGTRWEEDEMSFVEVTLASNRLFRIIRGLRHVLDQAESTLAGDGSRVLLALLPGDSHTLGIEMAANIFRRGGWHVDLSMGEGHDDILHRAETARFGAVVLVANVCADVGALTRLVVGLRIVAPVVPVVLAGKVLDTQDAAELCGVDAVLDDLDQAAEKLRTIADVAVRINLAHSTGRG